MNGIPPLLQMLLMALARALLPAAFSEIRRAARDGAEDGAPAPALKSRLRNRIGGRWTAAGGLALAAALGLGACGCGTRTVYIPDGEPVRLREPIKNAPVWVLDAAGQPLASRADLAEGWYVLSDPGPGK